MSTPAFPVSTLGLPSVNYSMAPKDITVRGKTRDGLDNIARASTAGYTEINVEWSWGAAQYAEFQDWYRNDCKDGSISFTIANLYHNNDLATLTARFKKQYACVYEKWEHYKVSATLEVPAHDYITESALNSAIAPYLIGPPYITTNPVSVTLLAGETLTLSVTATEISNALPTWYWVNIAEFSEEESSSRLSGSSGGYALPGVSRRSPITVTPISFGFEFTNEHRILFQAWWHYKLSDGTKWFRLYCPLHGVWQYATVRFIEPPSISYAPVDYWTVKCAAEVVEYNYIPLVDCDDMIPGGFLPVITVHPASANVVIGVSHTLTVTATNDALLSGALRYRWYLDGTPIDGATTASYTFTASASNDGAYCVIVSNNVGSVTSNTATIASGLAPTITTHPQAVELFLGDTLTLTVVATE